MTATSSHELASERTPGSAPSRARRPGRGYASGKDDYLTRLRKIEGQLRGVQKMIEDDRWCPDVVTQVSSVTRALQEVAVGLLNDHLHVCVIDAARKDPADARSSSTRSPAPSARWCGYERPGPFDRCRSARSNATARIRNHIRPDPAVPLRSALRGLPNHPTPRQQQASTRSEP